MNLYWEESLELAHAAETTWWLKDSDVRLRECVGRVSRRRPRLAGELFLMCCSNGTFATQKIVFVCPWRACRRGREGDIKDIYINMRSQFQFRDDGRSVP